MARRRRLAPIQEQKESYLRAFSEQCLLTVACKAAGVSNHTVLLWREHDDTFILRENELRAALADRLEAEAIRRAFTGWDRPVFQQGRLVGHERIYDGSLLKLLLIAYRPERFRENLHISGTVESIVREVIGFRPDEVL